MKLKLLLILMALSMTGCVGAHVRVGMFADDFGTARICVPVCVGLDFGGFEEFGIGPVISDEPPYFNIIYWRELI